MGSLLAFWNFAKSPFGRLLLTGVVALSIGFTGGWRVHKKFTDAAQLTALRAAYENRIKRLQADVRARDDAARMDQDRAVAAEDERSKAEEKARELETRVAAGVCFPDGGDADSVRSLWSNPAGAKRSPAAGAR